MHGCTRLRAALVFGLGLGTACATSGMDTPGPDGRNASGSDASASMADAPVPGPDGPAVEPCVLSLRLLTFNLLHGFPDFPDLEARTQMVVDTINELQPDLVAFQEIAQSFATANRAQVIAERTGYHWTWAAATGTAGVFEAGPGILSRSPFVLTRAFELPRPIIEDLVSRMLVEARVASACGELGFFSTHIGEIDDLDPTFVFDLTTAVYTIMLGEAVEGANFLGATINAEPDSESIKMLRGEATYMGITGSLTDLWMGFSDDPGNTYPSNNPRHRLDYLFGLDGAAATTNVVSCDHVLDEPAGDLYASDHIGMLCDVEITTSPEP